MIGSLSSPILGVWEPSGRGGLGWSRVCVYPFAFANEDPAIDGNVCEDLGSAHGPVDLDFVDLRRLAEAEFHRR